MAEVGGPASLLARTNLTLAVSAVMIAGIAIAALYAFVVNPISEQSADDEAALLVLSAQTWVELPPEALSMTFNREGQVELFTVGYVRHVWKSQ